MYFQLLHTDYPDLNNYYSLFYESSECKKNILIHLKHNEISVYKDDENLENSLVWQKEDVFTLNMADSDELDQFFLEVKKTGFSELDIYKSKPEYYIKYASLFSQKKLFKSKTKNSSIEFLLCLIEDIFDTNSEFNKHNPEECKDYRQLLTQSKVFEYINKKRMFYRSLYNYQQTYSSNFPPKRKDSSKPSTDFFTLLRKNYYKYLELLLKNEMTVHISPEIFDTDEWFLLDPEQELIALSKFEKEFGIDESSLLKIQNYLLTKHDIRGALNAGNRRFKINPFILQSISFTFFIFIALSWLCSWQTNVEILFTVGTLSSWASMFMALKSNKIRTNYNMVLFRLIVSIISSWLIIIALVDFLKFFINMDEVSYYTLLIVLPLITMLAIFLEVFLSSPYQIKMNKKLILQKVISVFIYVFNVSFIFGLFFSALIIPGYMNDNNEILNQNQYLKSEMVFVDSILSNTSIKCGTVYFDLKNLSKKNQVVALALNKDHGNNSIILADSNDSVAAYIKKIYVNKNINLKIEHLKINNAFNDSIGLYFSKLRLSNDKEQKDRFNKEIITTMFGKSLYFKLFLIHLMLVLAFSIISQAILSKDSITETI